MINKNKFENTSRLAELSPWKARQTYFQADDSDQIAIDTKQKKKKQQISKAIYNRNQRYLDSKSRQNSRYMSERVSLKLVDYKLPPVNLLKYRQSQTIDAYEGYGRDNFYEQNPGRLLKSGSKIKLPTHASNDEDFNYKTLIRAKRLESFKLNGLKCTQQNRNVDLSQRIYSYRMSDKSIPAAKLSLDSTKKQVLLKVLTQLHKKFI